MKNNKTSNLVVLNIGLLIPLILYGIYKNGYLIYSKGLINFVNIFKPLILVLIAVVIKIIIDLIKHKKVKIDYNLVYVILIGMIMPYNINYIIYIISFIILYIITLLIEKYIKFNKICFIYLIIVLINYLVKDFTYLTPLEQNYLFSYSFMDLLVGRNIGGISTTSILFSLLAYIVLVNNYYYKKDIPLTINITYLLLIIIYSIIISNTTYLLNSELIFASIFVSPLPEYSPYKQKSQIVYGICIGALTFILTILFNSIISIYISTFVVSLTPNIKIKHNKTKSLIEK